MSDMESPVTMGEAGENDCKEKSRSVEDGVCVNGNVSADDSMECIDKDDSKAHIISMKDVNSLKTNDKVPENKVPITNDSQQEQKEKKELELKPETGSKPEKIVEPEKIIESEKDLESEHGKENEEEPMEVDGELEETGEERDENKEKQKEDVLNVSSSKEEEEEEEKNDSINISSDVEMEEKPELEKMTNGTSDIVDLVDSVDLDDDDDDDPLKDDDKDSECVELNDSGDVVLIDNDSERKENGEIVCSSPEVEEVSVSVKDSNDNTPQTTPSKKKFKKSMESSAPPRRSSRNLNKQRSYIEKEDEPEPEAEPEPDPDPDPDIEEVTPVDPLAIADPLREEKETPKKSRPSTIVVSDTKRLVEIAANSKASNSSTGKKEPTLVIIDTNSILSGRGPVPVSHKPTSMSTSFSMMPVALPAQGVYPPNMRATITPIPMAPKPMPAPPVAPPAPILPSLTDDMYVVEAPSFIVPYVYEKPPIKPLKAFVENLGKELQDERKKEKEREREKEKEKEKATAKESTEDKSEKKPKSTKDGDESLTKTTENKEKESGSEESEKKSEEPASTVANKSASNDVKTIDLDDIPDEKVPVKSKSNSYFDNALGMFFINIGYGLVQEFVQTDLLKQQKRKQNREGAAPETRQAISSLIKNLEFTKENNEPYRLEQKKCEFCSFKTESGLAMAHHLETPHMRNYVYKCNFCPLEIRSPHDILFHMEAEHNIRGRLERAPAFHQCPNCPFEDNQKGKLSRHFFTCTKKFKPERNLEPPHDWEPPAKIPRVPRLKQGLVQTAATYQAFAAQAKGNYQLLSKLQQATAPQAFPRGRGRPSLMGKMHPVRTQPPIIRANMMYRPSTSGSVLVPTTYQFGGSPIYQVVGGQTDRLSGSACSPSPVALVPNLSSATSTVTIQNSTGAKSTSSKVVQQPSISITPLPRQPASASSASASSTSATLTKTPAGETSKATFVICEICDGYIKDLEQLRNHMQWIHKVKIHPKMIYNRPPLNCQKCQFRFFTDQGLERHLLGSHGLVTSSMQEAANKSKDSGRCPVCGRVYQWKLLNHVARDHNMTLKPAHLSYKCTVCTATFGMYKQFENHVYSAHSVVAKRVMEKKTTPSSVGRPNDSLLKPLKINDEITIIPQPAKSKTSSIMARPTSTNDRGK